MAWLLVMRKDNPPHEKGDVIEVWDDRKDGKAPDMGKGPLRDDEMGSMHTIIHVIGMSFEKARQYMGEQPEFNNFKDPLRNPNLKAKAWKLDIDSKVPKEKRIKMQGAKKGFELRYDIVTNKNREHPEDIEVTQTEFEAWVTLKPVLPST